MPDLTDEEIEALKELVPVAAHLREEAEFRMARRLVLATWRKGVIFLGGSIAAVIVLRDYLREAARWLVG